MNPTPTRAHLLRHGHALLLVPVEPQPPKADFLGPGWFWNHDWSAQIYGIWCANWEATAPYAPGDVIQVGDLAATVVQVMRPVRGGDGKWFWQVQLTAAEAAQPKG